MSHTVPSTENVSDDSARLAEVHEDSGRTVLFVWCVGGDRSIERGGKSVCVCGANRLKIVLNRGRRKVWGDRLGPEMEGGGKVCVWEGGG